MYLEKLRCDLQDLNQPCGLLNILIPDPTKIQHDYCYHHSEVDSTHHVITTYTNLESVVDNDIQSLSNILKEVKTEEDILNALSLSPVEWEELEINSREQSLSSLWFESRWIINTGSKRRCIILQKENTEALLCSCLYRKPMIRLLKSVSWGIQNEPKAWTHMSIKWIHMDTPV